MFLGVLVTLCRCIVTSHFALRTSAPALKILHIDIDYIFYYLGSLTTARKGSQMERPYVNPKKVQDVIYRDGVMPTRQRSSV